MPLSEVHMSPFYCGEHYHVLFRSIDGLSLFKNDMNRKFFLERFSLYFNPVSRLQAYCLLDNHVHFVITIKENELLLKSLTVIPNGLRTVSMQKFLLDEENPLLLDALIERQANRFMVSYANAYNKMYKRKGGLFQSPFRRSLINGDNHLQQAIIYVHANAQKHGITTDYRLYQHSSLNEILSGQPVWVDVTGVLNFFESLKKFTQCHDEQVAYFYANNWPSSRIEVD